ncbi:MAG: SDR family oxidoreductase [Opitutaceae bacterium]|nr:SDR family oxidoreductase [Cytophagales bacterium]
MSKVILVTGASSGLGEYLANFLSNEGYTVYGTSRSIQQEGRSFKTLKMDVCNTESVYNAIRTIIEKESKIDIVINNAGLGLASPFEHTSFEDIDRLFDTNVKGVIRVCQAVLPIMRSQRSGKIIQISSIASEFGLPYRGMYCASKAALERYTEALRMEVKKFGIQICLLQPGGIQTDINKNRMVSPIPANSPYKDSFNKCYEIVNASVSKGYPLEPFGPVVKAIIESKNIKGKYRISKFTEKLSVLLKTLLPASIFEGILIKHYKI